MRPEEDLRLGGQGQGLQNVSLMTSSKTKAISVDAYTVKKIYCIFTGSKSTERTVIFLPLQIVNFFTEIFSESVYGC